MSIVIWLNIVTIVARSVRTFPAHMHEDAPATRQLHCSWWSGQCHAKHAANAASVHNTCLYKIVCYLQRTFNRNQKQVTKLNASELGVCSKINACLHFFLDLPKSELLTFAGSVATPLWCGWKYYTAFVGNLVLLSSGERILELC